MLCLLMLTFLSFSLKTSAQEVPDITALFEDEKNFDFEEVMSVLRKKEIKNKEEFLKSLPKEFKENYIIMYDSNSVQSSSFQEPRVLIRSPKSEVIFSFSGKSNSTNPHDNNIEAIFWRPEEKKFEMKEISFGQQGMKESHSNPKSCLQCHGEDPRPNWEPYSI